MASGQAASDESELLAAAGKLSPVQSLALRQFAHVPVPFSLETDTGKLLHLGQGPAQFHITAHSRAGMRALLSLNERRIAEAYLDGQLDVSGDMLEAFRLREVLRDQPKLLGIWRFIEPLLFGQVRANRKAIASHYEQDAEFFFNFLDPEVPLYTQGIFLADDDTLRDASARKLEYCFDACRLKPGDHILEIGPGWGSWLKYASERGVKCSAISISQYSLDYLRGEATRLGHDWELIFCDLLEFRPTVKYDAIVMMGIIEHLPQYRAVLQRFVEMLKPGGRIFLDGSTATEKYELSSTTLAHIFPGNHSPWVLHDFMADLARTPLFVQELFDDRHSYFLSLKNWALNWERNESTTLARFGQYAYRRFRLYFWGTALQFRDHQFGCYRMILGSRPEGSHQQAST